MPPRQSGPNLDQPNPDSRVQDGATLTGANLNRIGYALARWGNIPDNTTAARLRMLILEKFQVMYWGVWNDYLRSSGVPSEVDNRNAVDAMWNEAIANAGPYTASPLAVTVNGSANGGTVSGIGYSSASGALQAGRSYTAQIISGNALWDGNNSATISGTTGASLSSLDFHVAPGGTDLVQVQVSYTGIPDWRVGVRTSNTGGQAVFYGRTTSLAATVQSADPIRDQFEYQIQTVTSDAVVTQGTAISDTLHVSMVDGAWDPPGHAITVTSTLYGPFTTAPTEQATVPAGAPAAGSVTTTITGPGTYTTPSLTPPAPGYYVWHETAPADEHSAGWSGRLGVAAETTLVRWRPEVVTAITADVLEPGGLVGDDFTVTGGRPGETVTVTGTLYRDAGTLPPTQQATVPDDATEIGTSSTDVVLDGSGSFTGTLPPIEGGSQPGYYTWVVSIVESGTTEGYTSEYGIPGETGVVRWDPLGRTRATYTTDIRVSAGATPTGTMTLLDDVTFEGLPDDLGSLDGEDVRATVELFFVHHSRVVMSPTVLTDLSTMCTPENRIGSTTVEIHNGTVTATSDQFQVPMLLSDRYDGFYMFTHTFAGSERVNAHQGECAERDETLYLSPSAMVRDRLALTGGNPVEGFPAASAGLIALGASLLAASRWALGRRRREAASVSSQR